MAFPRVNESSMKIKMGKENILKNDNFKMKIHLLREIL